MPEVDSVWQRYAGDSRVLVLTVATGTQSRIEQIRAEDHLGVPISWAPEGWTEIVGIHAFPETIFLDPSGHVAARIPRGTDEAELVTYLDALLAERDGQTVGYLPHKDAKHSLSSRVVFALEGLLPHPGPGPADPFTWSVKRRGDAVLVRLDIPRHHHVSRDQVEITWIDATGEQAISLPPGQMLDDPNTGPVEQYTRDLVVRVPASGPGTLRVRHQGCTGDQCFAPVEQEIAVP